MATIRCQQCGGRVLSDEVAVGERSLICVNCGRPWEPPRQQQAFRPSPLELLSPFNRKPQLW